jgi:predicted thioesterase
MTSAPKIGTTGEHRFIVALEHAITFASDGMPAVLSTPNLVARGVHKRAIIRTGAFTKRIQSKAS